MEGEIILHADLWTAEKDIGDDAEDRGQTHEDIPGGEGSRFGFPSGNYETRCKDPEGGESETNRSWKKFEDLIIQRLFSCLSRKMFHKAEIT